MALNENQLQGSLNQHNKHNFWHFLGDLLEECSTQLLRGVRGVRTLAEVSVGQALGQMGVLGCGCRETTVGCISFSFSGLLWGPADSSICSELLRRIEEKIRQF